MAMITTEVLAILRKILFFITEPKNPKPNRNAHNAVAGDIIPGFDIEKISLMKRLSILKILKPKNSKSVIKPMPITRVDKAFRIMW